MTLRIIRNHERQNLQAAVNQTLNSPQNPSDYIATTESQYRHYSRQCGMIAALYMALGITDGHLENNIVHQRRPHPIDLEVTLQPVDDLTGTYLLGSHTGAMSKASIHQEAHVILFDIEGMGFVSLTTQDKNIFYRLNTHNQPIACNPNKEEFLQGFYDVTAIVVQQLSLLEPWFTDHLTRRMPIRYLPYSTEKFQSEIKQEMWANFFDSGTFQKIQKTRIENENRPPIILPTNEENQDEPCFAVYLTDNIYRNYCTLNIPVFYALADSRKLVDSEGNVVRIDYRRAATLLGYPCSAKHVEIDGQLVELPEERTDYFTQTPLEYTRSRLNQLHANAQRLQNYLDEMTAEISSLLANPSPLEEKSSSEPTSSPANEAEEEQAATPMRMGH